MRRRPIFWTIVIALEVAFWTGAAIALYHGHPLLVSLLLCFWVVRSEGIPVPAEIGFWVLGASLLEAFLQGEMAVFALESPLAIIRVFTLLHYLSAGRRARRWEDYFLGTVPYPGLSAAAYRWRQRGRVASIAGEALMIAIAVISTAGMWWWAYRWGAWWRLPYLIALSVLALWWCILGVRAVRRLILPPGSEADEHSLAPLDWSRQAAYMYTQPIAWRTSGLPPAVLDLETGFRGSDDRRLRHFAADCAEHVLPAQSRAVGGIRNSILAAIQCARRRADGDLAGWELRVALRQADTTISRSGGRISGTRGDLATLRELDDAASAAYHALCAPTPLDAATYAANCASVTVDGELREDEHRWQLQRLDDYRAQRADPA